MINNEKVYPRVLVITRNGWNNSNCTGNTLSNFFHDWPKDKIANVFCRAEIVSNNVCTTYFQITEQDIIRSLKDSSFKPGKRKNYLYDVNDSCYTKDIGQSKKIYSFFGKHRWTIALWARDLLWSIGNWGNSNFDSFLNDFNPQVLYMPCYDSVYMHRILWYIKEKTGAGVVLFTGDDTYTLKQFSFSPLYWINRILNRATMRKSVKLADTLFVISDKQKLEYDNIFKRDCVLLRKGGDFSKEFLPKSTICSPIKLVYTGNIHSGRWKTLAELVKAIKQVNVREIKIELDIYTLSPRTEEIITNLNVEGCARLMPPATDKEIGDAIYSADALIFVEPFQLKEMLKWRLSFSTKIVDYLASSRAIIAIGPKGLASMDYLQSNDAAICINSKEEIYTGVKEIIDQPNLLIDYAKKAWDCGYRNNDISNTEVILFNILSSAARTKIDGVTFNDKNSDPRGK